MTSLVTVKGEAFLNNLIEASRPKFPFPLVCAVSNQYTQSVVLPDDGVCDFIFYDSLYKGNSNIFTEPLSPDVSFFVQDGKNYTHTELGFSFDIRNSQFVSEYTSTAFRDKVRAVSSQGVLHFGILDMDFSVVNSGTVTQALQILKCLSNHLFSNESGAETSFTSHPLCGALRREPNVTSFMPSFVPRLISLRRVFLFAS
ncbi:hypothetical protein V5799_024493 [Amblyomma americanum]|uniref:Uncharacterized protein n=1 Tax=Amblyomma americanum TaxID=6943 RepID=A0AAQ4ECD8_AMBAM